MQNEESEYIYIPGMEKFFANKRRNESLMWVPIQCSLLFSGEFEHLRTTSKYVYMALMLICGFRGTNTLPFNISYLARFAGVNRRTMRNGVEELLCAEMLTKRDREKESTESTTQTVQTERENGVVRVDLSKSTQNKSPQMKDQAGTNGNNSAYSLEEIIKYVEICQSKGDEVRNPRALASNLYQTGSADAFIRAALYPELQKEDEKAIYGEPVRFSDDPCKTCFGGKMYDPDGEGYRPCDHCKNEKGKPTGREPLKVENSEK